MRSLYWVDRGILVILSLYGSRQGPTPSKSSELLKQEAFHLQETDRTIEEVTKFNHEN